MTSISLSFVGKNKLPGKSQGQKRLVGYSPQDRKKLDTTEQLSTHRQRQYLVLNH